jgi:dinuclear metal center YbgI/SA1388 family protein
MDEFAPPGLAFDWDHIGLGIGDPEWNVARVLVALSVTPEAARAAIRSKANLIVSHHPVIWDPIGALRMDDPHMRMCVELADAGIACFAAHTNLDAAPGGVNDTLAGLLGLEARRPLFPLPHAGVVKLVTFVPESHLEAVREAVCAAGAGVIGEYAHCSFSVAGMGTFLPGDAARPYSGQRGRVNEEPERRFEALTPKVRLAQVVRALMNAHPYETPAYDIVPLENGDPGAGLGVRGEWKRPETLRACCERVRAALGLDAVRCVGDLRRRIKTAAVLGGSGGGEVSSIPSEIDVYVTGELGYHDALAARERGLAIIEAGHDGTERCIIPVVAQFLRKRFPALQISTHIEPGVFRSLVK